MSQAYQKKTFEGQLNNNFGTKLGRNMYQYLQSVLKILKFPR